MPICIVCNKMKPTAVRQNENSICSNCYSKVHIELCDICSVVKTVSSRTENGRAICPSCERNLKKEACSTCHKVGIVAVRSEDKKAICHTCYYKLHVGTCFVCGEVKNIAGRRDGKAICPNCKVMTTPKRLYQLYKKGAEKREIEFYLTYEKFVEFTSSRCFYCNEISEKFCTGIDRVDNNVGYSIENCVPCCWPCNQMKGKLLQTKFLEKSKQITEFWSKK